MKKCLIISLSLIIHYHSFSQEKSKTFTETDGYVKIEAEHFCKQEDTVDRKWYVISLDKIPAIHEGENHVDGASGGAYIEILPDTRQTHDDSLIWYENFTNEPGKLGVLHYKVKFTTPGRYHVFARAYSTGTEDNGIHVGLNGTWPESGQRMQWCEGKHTWRWESKQRTREVHCGVPYQIFLDIAEPGVHDIMFSMREDGFEFDAFILTLDKEYDPGQ